MNEFITKITNYISLDVLIGKNWLDYVTILAPSVLLIIGLFCLSLLIKFRKWRFTAYFLCALLALVYLPYELLRQATLMTRAETNVKEMQSNLQELLNSANLGHLNEVADQKTAASFLDDLKGGLNQDKKKDLILVSWSMAENEKHALSEIDHKQQSLANEIKASLNETKSEIIESRPPVEKISDSIVKRLDSDINQLVEKKMDAFKQEIDNSLDSFKEKINTFVQGELNNYQEKLAVVTQQNVDELRNYSSKATHAFSQHANRTNQESLKKIDAAKNKIDEAGATIAQTVTQQVKKLTASIELAQKKNDIFFEYNECMRTAGLLDFAGKEQQCKTKLDQEMSSLK
ncbi:MAG: hypothetical protein DYH15_04775 [Nitrosomonas sp. PRO4]|nr:hypothetical protein [Nitrosomonas sp. PRO4]